MADQTSIKRLEKKEAEQTGRRKDRETKTAQEKKPEKKWKGKDWFDILSPKVFGESVVAETPAVDTKSVVGRNLEINLTDIDPSSKNFHMKFNLKVTDIAGNTARTRFNGFSCTKDHLLRIVRKRSQKITMIEKFGTKDGWELQLTATVVLNKNTETTIRRKIRGEMSSILKDTLSKSTADSFVKSISNNSIQKGIRKQVSRIYPVRFSEIEKVEVLKAG